jgi:hypothetical protein
VAIDIVVASISPAESACARVLGWPNTHAQAIGPEMVACDMGAPDRRQTFAHVAIRSGFDRQESLLRGQAEGRLTRICDRGPFECVEIRLEDRLPVEAPDPAMQRNDAQAGTMANWTAQFGLA